MNIALERIETFAIAEGHLVRTVMPARGKPYEHWCERDSYEGVAHAIDEMGLEPFVLEDLLANTSVPWSQAAAAFAFMKERGCVVSAHGRRHRAASGAVFEDAMIEFCALDEKDDE